jgi:UDP-N-acetylmuramate dehydrogenase
MVIVHNKNLADFVTMKIGGPAKAMAIANSERDVAESVVYAKQNGLKILTIGSGSNIIFRDEGFDGLVIVNKINGCKINKNNGLATAGSGYAWDYLVQETINNGLIGIEALSNIPGTVGAGPINNIGAYGQELKDTLLKVKAYDTETDQIVEINNQDCEFDYRNSRFKSKDYGRFIITSVSFQLKQLSVNYNPPDYSSLNKELTNSNIINPTPQNVRDALIKIRTAKLPNPLVLPNTGSFFKNPFIEKQRVEALLAQYPDMPYYTYSETHEKLAAGWLIEQSGLKGYRQNGIWVYDEQALVLVNESAKTFKDLWLMAEHVIKIVEQKFDIMLDVEPEII